MAIRQRTNKLSLKSVGPIQSADVAFGDLTVIVGPQATGKSIFLQTLKLVLDRDHIHDTFKHHSLVFNVNRNNARSGCFSYPHSG